MRLLIYISISYDTDARDTGQPLPNEYHLARPTFQSTGQAVYTTPKSEKHPDSAISTTLFYVFSNYYAHFLESSTLISTVTTAMAWKRRFTRQIGL